MPPIASTPCRTAWPRYSHASSGRHREEGYSLKFERLFGLLQSAKMISSALMPVLRSFRFICLLTAALIHPDISYHIINHIDKHWNLDSEQQWFCWKLSCESQMLVTTHNFPCRLDSKDVVDVAILDFSMAFDVVTYHRLLRNLLLYGIDVTVLSWIAGFILTNLKSVK